jgi:hypothetical protein
VLGGDSRGTPKSVKLAWLSFSYRDLYRCLQGKKTPISRKNEIKAHKMTAGLRADWGPWNLVGSADPDAVHRESLRIKLMLDNSPSKTRKRPSLSTRRTQLNIITEHANVYV